MARVLLIDDDPSLLEVLSLAFEDAGHAVQTAPDGAVALRTLADAGIELVVSDVNMPLVDGLALCRKLRNTYQLGVVTTRRSGDHQPRHRHPAHRTPTHPR